MNAGKFGLPGLQRRDVRTFMNHVGEASAIEPVKTLRTSWACPMTAFHP